MMEKDNINVNMEGKDYLALLKYRESKRTKLSKKDVRTISVIGLIIACLIGLMITAELLIQKINPTTHVRAEIGPYWILGFLSICLGVGWVLHGVGFFIVKG